MLQSRTQIIKMKCFWNVRQTNTRKVNWNTVIYRTKVPYIIVFVCRIGGLGTTVVDLQRPAATLTILGLFICHECSQLVIPVEEFCCKWSSVANVHLERYPRQCSLAFPAVYHLQRSSFPVDQLRFSPLFCFSEVNISQFYVGCHNSVFLENPYGWLL